MRRAWLAALALVPMALCALLLAGCGSTGAAAESSARSEPSQGGPSDGGSPEAAMSYKEPEPGSIVQDGADTYYVNDVIDVTVVSGTSREQVDDLASRIGGKVVGEIGLTGDYQIQLDEPKTLDEMERLAESLAEDPIVEVAMPEELFETDANYVPNDGVWRQEGWDTDDPEGSNWGVEAIDAPDAWDLVDEMQPVAVGVIDSMFDASHEDLSFARVINNPSHPDDKHGTHVSGTIAAGFDNGRGIAGIAPTADLYGFSTMGEDSDPTVLNGHYDGYMKWKYGLAELVSSGCRVINVSMGLTFRGHEEARRASELDAQVYTPFLGKLLDRGYDFVIVQAAGNDGEQGCDAVETGIFAGITDERLKDRIIVVGAAENAGDGRYRLAAFSNTGNRVDVAAPGVDICSTVPGGYEGGWSGTSMAAPHVSGIAALCYALDPGLTGDQVKRAIVDTADRGASSASGTYAMPDASAAVASVRPDLGRTGNDEAHEAYERFVEDGDWSGYVLDFLAQEAAGTSAEYLGSRQDLIGLMKTNGSSNWVRLWDIDSDGVDELFVSSGGVANLSLSAFSYDTATHEVAYQGSVLYGTMFFDFRGSDFLVSETEPNTVAVRANGTDPTGSAFTSWATVTFDGGFAFDSRPDMDDASLASWHDGKTLDLG